MLQTSCFSCASEKGECVFDLRLIKVFDCPSAESGVHHAPQSVTCRRSILYRLQRTPINLAISMQHLPRIRHSRFLVPFIRICKGERTFSVHPVLVIQPRGSRSSYVALSSSFWRLHHTTIFQKRRHVHAQDKLMWIVSQAVDLLPPVVVYDRRWTV